ncbi:MAG: sulfurtransferase [Methylacidiphilales bacterium]|nr:sulfurtransferase [Candidatus Methylacidiphilales bacterium]NJR15602.1 sulfurtransferase [Calothrix sp. CSU_2_0]
MSFDSQQQIQASATNNYTYPQVIVETEWVAKNLDNPNIRILEVDMDANSYETGHLSGAVFWHSFQTVSLPDMRYNFNKEALEKLLSQSGINNDTTIIVYSNHNAIAPVVFWFLTGFGHHDVRVIDGGKKKWIAENRHLTKEILTPTKTEYKVQDFDQNLRVEFNTVLQAINNPSYALVDVRTAEEYRGELFMMKPPEAGERGGHIPGAAHIRYQEALREDDTFKSVAELKALYESKGVSSDKNIIIYCAVGARAAHTWFVLKYLLGYSNVRNYDASWSEWGSRSDTPVEQ